MVIVVILIIVSYCIPLIFINYKDRKKILLIWFIITVYHVVSFINGFLFRTPGADVDALLFHANAVRLKQVGNIDFGLWADFYTSFLAFVYDFSGSDLIMVGQSLSIIFVSFSIVLFIRLFKLIRPYNRSSMSVLVLFLLPSMIFVCPITLRESYEIFFSLLSFYCFWYYFYSQKKVWLVFSAIVSFLMGLFHPVLSIWALYLFFFILLEVFGINLKRVVNFFAKRKVVILIVIGLCLTLIPLSYKQTRDDLQGENLISSLLKGNLIQYAIYKRNASIRGAELSNANATYGVPFEMDSIPALLISSSKMVLYYFAAPFPWKVGRGIDVYSVGENMWRIILIILSVKSIAQYHEKRYLLSFMFFSYIFISVLWAMGTVNYGTAMRHHLVGYWILILLGFPELEASIIKIVNKKKS